VPFAYHERCLNASSNYAQSKEVSVLFFGPFFINNLFLADHQLITSVQEKGFPLPLLLPAGGAQPLESERT
jgi:hypothetical protein